MIYNPWTMPTKKKGENLKPTGWGFYPPLKQALLELAREESERLVPKISVPTIIRTLTTVNSEEMNSRRDALAKRIKQIEEETKHENRQQRTKRS